MAPINHPLSLIHKSSLKAFAWAIAEKSTNPNRFNPENWPGDKWYRNFEGRHNLTNRKPDNIDRGRSRMGNTQQFGIKHFDLLEETIDRLHLRDNPKAIFNCDESMIAMDRRSGTVVVSRKTKHAYSEIKGTRDHITVNACVGIRLRHATPYHFLTVLSTWSLLLEMDQMERYIQYLIMGVWIANFFMVLFRNYSSPTQTEFLALNYLI